jgi:hypothetical protein
LPLIGDFGADTLSILSPPASSALWCAVSLMDSSRGATSASLAYSPSDSGIVWEFADPCPAGRPILFRNAVAHDGEIFEVRSVSPEALQNCQMSAVCISRNVAILGGSCLSGSLTINNVAFECDSHLREIGRYAFSYCGSLQSIAVPSSVGFFGPGCFHACRSLGSVTFERRSKLATIEESAFWNCPSLNWLSIPASVTMIGDSAFGASGIRWIEIEDGSVSFRVVNEFLVDFESRSLIYGIGSPDSVEIPSSIEELRPYCFAMKDRLRTVEFESDSTLGSIAESAFDFCESLKSVCIPSSVEVLRKSCFKDCGTLRTVKFGAESKLRRIERDAFAGCDSVGLVSLPASVEIIGQQPVISVSRS